jgi:hypothetical protein
MSEDTFPALPCRARIISLFLGIVESRTGSSLLILPARENVSDIVLAPGMFLWLFPNEPHRPGCVCPGFGGEVVKGVVKVRMR